MSDNSKIVCECGAMPSPSEPPGCGLYMVAGELHYICLRCWQIENYGEAVSTAVAHPEHKAAP